MLMIIVEALEELFKAILNVFPLILFIENQIKVGKYSILYIIELMLVIFAVIHECMILIITTLVVKQQDQ